MRRIKSSCDDANPGISASSEHEVIRDVGERCQMCGRVAAANGVDHVVDRRMSSGYRTRSQADGLWVICEECSAGLEAYLSPLGLDVGTIGKIWAHRSVHVRIGELLKAVGVGNRAPSSLIEGVAGQQAWKKRLRELRYPVIGWRIEAHVCSSRSGRRNSEYTLIHARPWPEDPTGAIRRFEETRRLRSNKP